MHGKMTPGGCIPREELEALATRALGGAGVEGAPEGGPAAVVAGLFQPGEGDLRSHVERCEMCRETLEELIEFVSYYRKAVETAEVDERFDALLRNISLEPSEKPESVPEGIELVYEPYTQPFEEEPSLAAATERPEREPLRFCSGDGNYILEEIPGFATGEPSYLLVGERGIRTSGVEIEIDGRVLITDRNGLLDAGSVGFSISKDSRIRVRTENSD